MEKATFGAGCFWGVEEAFRGIKGVEQTTVGYMGGKLENPTYEDVCTNKTGHAEVVEIIYNPNIVSYENLLEKFWEIHKTTGFFLRTYMNNGIKHPSIYPWPIRQIYCMFRIISRNRISSVFISLVSFHIGNRIFD